VEGRPLDEQPDSQAVARARAGDGAAFGQLVQRYQELAFRTAYLVVGKPAEAEDAAQEAFVKAYHALSRFRPGAAFRPWLLKIVANEARNRRRAAGRRAHLALRAAGATPSGNAAPSPEATVLAEEQRRALLYAVNGLPDHDRLVIGCRLFLELTEAETAAVMQCAPGTVKSRLSRALGRLRERLARSADLREPGAVEMARD
jgi:RNA polymerase sigma factor (sigma-70 family)